MIIIMYIYRALINALSAHVIHTNLTIIFCTHAEHSPTKTTHALVIVSAAVLVALCLMIMFQFLFLFCF